METIALTEWEQGISPLYDAACSLSILTGEGKRTVYNVAPFSLIEKAHFCGEKQVDVLICGAISTLAADILAKSGIRVIAWICGPVDAVINNYRIKGTVDERYRMPGCKKTCRDGKRQMVCRDQKRNGTNSCIHQGEKRKGHHENCIVSRRKHQK